MINHGHWLLAGGLGVHVSRHDVIRARIAVLAHALPAADVTRHVDSDGRVDATGCHVLSAVLQFTDRDCAAFARHQTGCVAQRDLLAKRAVERELIACAANVLRRYVAAAQMRHLWRDEYSGQSDYGIKMVHRKPLRSRRRRQLNPS